MYNIWHIILTFPDDFINIEEIVDRETGCITGITFLNAQRQICFFQSQQIIRTISTHPYFRSIHTQQFRTGVPVSMHVDELLFDTLHDDGFVLRRNSGEDVDGVG